MMSFIHPEFYKKQTYSLNDYLEYEKWIYLLHSLCHYHYY